MELGRNLGILDFRRGAKVARTQFAVYIVLGALIEKMFWSHVKMMKAKG